jgi:hypothetical protein
MTVRIAPIMGKEPIAELAIRSQIDFAKFAEIVYVQLKQVTQDRLLFRRSGDDLDLYGRLVWLLCH